jgi:CHAD domain-containing protein
LAKGSGPQAVAATTVAVTRGMSAGRAFQTIGWNALVHAVGNLGLVIARGDPAAIHQLRVAIRRMRAALSLFGRDLLAQDDQAKALRKELHEVALLLSPARDLHVLARGMGEPPHALLRAEAVATARAQQALSEHRFQSLWLRFALWLEVGAYLNSPMAGAAVEPLAASMIEHQRKAIRGARKHLSHMSDGALHDLRKDVKKLRYSASFFNRWIKSRVARAHQEALEQVQDALGDIQDTASAVQAGPKIARLLDLSRREAVLLQAQLDAGLGLSSHGRDAALERAREGLEREKACAGWWKAL